MGFGGGAFGTGSYAYSVIDNQTIQLNQQKGVIYANATISEIQNIISQNGAISGTIAYSEPATSKYYKKFIVTLSNFQNQNPTNFLSNSGTSGIGEAPQLSSTYAQYDNGASVFNNYWNFAGTSLPSGWTTSGTGSATVNNGLTVSSGGANWFSLTYGTALNPQTLVLDAYAYFTGFYLSENWADIQWQTSSGSIQNGLSQFNAYILQNVNNGAVASVTISGGSTTSYQVWSIGTTSTYSYIILNYGTPITLSTDFSANTSEQIALDVYQTSYSIKVQWLRTRAYPPNGVMPSVSFGSFTSSSGASITIPSGIDYYMPITITNNQSVATPSPFQQMIQININNYSNYMYFDGNIANFEFFTSSGTIIPAWIESNNNGTLTIWVKLSSGIGANSSITIYLGVANIYQFSITYPVAFTTEANIIYNSGITASTTLTTLTITLNSLQQMNGTIIVEGY